MQFSLGPCASVVEGFSAPFAAQIPHTLLSNMHLGRIYA